MSDRILDPTIGALNTSLNLRLMNQNIISSNIANSDTPGYKAKSVDFERSFRDALRVGDDMPMAVTDSKHIYHETTDPVRPETYEEPGEIGSLDENTVNRSLEMSKLAENQNMYNASVEMMKRKLGTLRYAVNEGGGNR